MAIRKKYNIIEFLSALLPIGMLFWAYVVPGTNSTSLALYIVFAGCIIVLIRKNKIESFCMENKIIAIFAVYTMINQIFLCMVYPDALTPILKNLLFNSLPAIVALLILSKNINFTIFYKIYSVIIWVVFIGLLYQSFEVYILHQPTKMIILPFMGRAISASTYNYINYWYARTRPSSFFPEPSIYVNFVVPYIIVSLKKRKYIAAIMQSLGVFLTTSTTGVVLVAGIWLYWSFICVKKVYLKLICGLFLCIAAVLLIQSDIFVIAFRKLINTNFYLNERTGSSLQIFLQMPWRDRLIGVGCGNVGNYLATHHVNVSMIEVTVNGYVTSGFGNFIYYGVIGGVLYIVLCLIMIIKSNKWARLTAILIMCLSFSQTMSFGLMGVWWFTFFQQIKNDEAMGLCRQKDLYISKHKISNMESEENPYVISNIL